MPEESRDALAERIRRASENIIQSQGQQPPQLKRGGRQRPIWIWIIVLFYGCGAISQLVTHTMMLTQAMPIPTELTGYLESWTVFDKVIPYILSLLLLVTLVYMFLLRKVAVSLFGIYVGLAFLATVQQAITTNWLASYGMIGVVSAGFGLFLSGLSILYLIRLKTRHVLA
jgi:hypothetical protein